MLDIVEIVRAENGWIVRDSHAGKARVRVAESRHVLARILCERLDLPLAFTVQPIEARPEPADDPQPAEVSGEEPAAETQGSDRERQVLDVLREMGPGVSSSALAERMGVASRGYLRTVLRRLVDTGQVRMSGQKRGTRYSLPEQPQEIDPKPKAAVAPEPKPEPKEIGPGRPREGQPKRRFTEHFDANPEEVNGIAADHEAATDGRTIFPSSVTEPEDGTALLMSGANSRKLGDPVVKGPWKGFPIYSLTLEERATCPKTCHHWLTCYGNGMPFARRNRYGLDLHGRLDRELAALNRKHREGFVVRLHILGDFPTVEYVELWGRWLTAFKALHVFGYTAWRPETEVGAAVARLSGENWGRFAIRRSSAEPEPGGATTIWRKPEAPVVPEGIVCPAQTGATECCGTCGLCWHPAAREKTIAFVAHGRKGQRPGTVRKGPAEVHRLPPPPDHPKLQAMFAADSIIRFLREAGHEVAVHPTKAGLYVMDGEHLTARQLATEANGMRARAGLTLFPIPAIDPPSGGQSSLGNIDSVGSMAG